MNIFSAEDLYKAYGERVLFRGLTFGISKGEKIALVAPNGAGKSTLLRIIAGKEEADRGKLAVREGTSICYLEQEPVFDDALTINQLILGSHSETLALIRKYERLSHGNGDGDARAHALAMEEVSAKLDALQAWDYERRLKEFLDRFRITELDQKIRTLSGGQRKRLALVFALLDNPELLLLDEPTNHLDIEMIEWLEDYLSRASSTILMVTHDRYFLNRVCSQIWELDEGVMNSYAGNYEFFLEKKEERELAGRKESQSTRNLMRKELDWIRRMPKARTTKSKSRIKAFYELEKKNNNRKSERDIKLEVKLSRIGNKILDIKNLYKIYSNNIILRDFTYTFKKGERIGIIGNNGVGKSSFLNLITANEKADSGSIDKGETIVFGYYRQQGISIDGNKRVIEVVQEIADMIELANGKVVSASALLQRFLFPPSMQYTYVSSLSGGERRRLYLLTVLLNSPNFLVMDEPTNDLDILTLNTLEDFLENYPGCLILVSHDRFFMDKLVDQLFIFEGEGRIVNFPGNYSDYRESKELARESEEMQGGKGLPEKPQSGIAEIPALTKKSKLSFREKQEFLKLQLEIDALEKEKMFLDNEIAEAGSDYQKLQKASGRLHEVIEQLDLKTMRWLELSEFEG